ncbi:MAG: hypothetical protein M1436_07820 [Acidobacteria bacterium]|nr:hypothetical protein [Acidobacteriota bacterium]
MYDFHVAWSGIIRSWDNERRQYRQLLLRFEDCEEPVCLARLYDGDRPIGDARADNAYDALEQALRLAREFFHDPSITEASVAWCQVT